MLFPVTPCSPAELDKWDILIGMTAKDKLQLWRSTPNAMVREDIHNFGLGSPSIYVEFHRRLASMTAMVREDIHNFGLGSPSIYVEFHRRLASALSDSLVDPSCRHKLVTSCLFSH